MTEIFNTIAQSWAEYNLGKREGTLGDIKFELLKFLEEQPELQSIGTLPARYNEACSLLKKVLLESSVPTEFDKEIYLFLQKESELPADYTFYEELNEESITESKQD